MHITTSLFFLTGLKILGVSITACTVIKIINLPPFKINPMKREYQTSQMLYCLINIIYFGLKKFIHFFFFGYIPCDFKIKKAINQYKKKKNFFFFFWEYLKKESYIRIVLQNAYDRYVLPIVHRFILFFFIFMPS